MISFSIDKPLTRELLALNDEISEKYSQIKALPNDELQMVHKYARISTIGASTRIENAILTDSEVDWLDSVLNADGKKTAFNVQRNRIEEKLSKDRERSIEEVAGCRTVLLLVYEQAKSYFPLTAVTIRGLHSELLRHYSKSGLNKGEFKGHPNSVVEVNHETGEKRQVFKTADPGIETETAMSNLIAWYNDTTNKEPWHLAVACELVYRFLAIHPFQDGNGRLGRALFLMSLLHAPHEKLAKVAYCLAIDRYIERYKEEYYIVLNQCSDGIFSPEPTSYKIDYFLKYMIKVLQGSLNDVDFYIKRAKTFKKLSESALTVLACFKELPEVRVRTRDLKREIDLPERTIRSALASLTKGNFIQRYGQGAATHYQLIF